MTTYSVDPYRLSHVVVPRRYDLVFEPDIERGQFDGSATIALEVEHPVESLALNAVGLDVTSVTLVGPDGSATEPGVEYDAPNERILLHGPLVAGSATLQLEFTSAFDEGLDGFYLSRYHDADGDVHAVATSQFQSTFARKAFPCFDQPDMKAVFGVTLVVPEGLMAISNSPVASSEPAENGKVRWVFRDTMVMSPYLLALIVGRLEASRTVDVDGVPLRVVHVPGKGHLTDFALEIGEFALRYLADYYEIPYPGEKIDLVAIPDFAWGAMENFGAITFREKEILVDPQRATQAELARVADVVAHELAHMWFGDLVTMKWWNGVWLNEAFATFMEMKCADAFRPEWKRWLSFATEHAGRGDSMDIDALESTRPVEFTVTSPEEAESMFDALTYGKGAAVVRMLERFVGAAAFREGINQYLATHAYGNAETDDLWHALQSISHLDVGALMEGWIRRGGYPVVSVTPAADGVTLTQEQFLYRGEGDQRWEIPMLYRHLDTGEEGSLVLGRSAALDVPPMGLVVNAGGHGFYRVRYGPELLHALGERFGELDAMERVSLIADTWALVLRGDAAAAEILGLVERVGFDPEPVMWEAIAHVYHELDRIASPAAQSRLQDHIRRTMRPALDAMGFEPAPGESELDRRKRGVLLDATGVLGADEEVRRYLRSVFDADLGDGADADVVGAAVAVVGATGDLGDYERLVELYKRADSPQAVIRYLRAATAIPHQEAADRTFEMVMTGGVRSQDGANIFARLLGHRTVGPHVWRLWKERWDEMVALFSIGMRRRLLDFLPNRTEPDLAVEIRDFLNEHPLAGGERYKSQQLERMFLRVALRQREAERL